MRQYLAIARPHHNAKNFMVIVGVGFACPYLDVLSEAVNSPLRFTLGWLIVRPQELPSISLILAFWMAGAFEMARKRLKEYRFLGDRTVAAAYRQSFSHYDERRLKVSMVAYAIAAIVFGIGAFSFLYGNGPA